MPKPPNFTCWTHPGRKGIWYVRAATEGGNVYLSRVDTTVEELERVHTREWHEWTPATDEQVEQAREIRQPGFRESIERGMRGLPPKGPL